MRCGEGDQIHPPKSKHSISFPVPPGRISRLTQTQSQSSPVPAASPPFQAMGPLRRRTPAGSAASADNTPTEPLSLDAPSLLTAPWPPSIPQSSAEPTPAAQSKRPLQSRTAHDAGWCPRWRPSNHRGDGRRGSLLPSPSPHTGGYRSQEPHLSLCQSPGPGAPPTAGVNECLLNRRCGWGMQWPSLLQSCRAKETGWQRNGSCRVRKVKRS